MSNNAENHHFKSNDFAVRAQKKILGQFASRKVAKVFISDGLSSLLDLLYQLIKSHTHEKKVAEKFVKNIIKLSIKIGVLAQNGQFSKEEIQGATKFAEKIRTIAMTITSFIEVDFSYDRNFLLKSITDCEGQMVNLVKAHVTEKSVTRIRSVCTQLKDPGLLDSSFRRGTPQFEIMEKVVAEINHAIDAGEL